MKKENKLWLPLVIVLAVLVVGLFVATIVVNNTIGKHEPKKGTGEVVELDDDNSSSGTSYETFEGDDFSYQAEVNVTVIPPLENPKGYIIKQDPSYYEWTEDTFKDLTAEELYYAYYEIFARDGAKFDDATIQSYFDGKDWYYGYSRTTISSLMEDYEDYNYDTVLDNIALLQQYVEDNNLTYTP